MRGDWRWLVVVSMVLLLALVTWRFFAAASPTRAAAQPAESVAHAPEVTPAASPVRRDVAPGEAVALADLAAEEEEEPAPAPHDDHRALERYRELTRYPESSRKLTEESRDLLYPNRRYEKRMRLPLGEQDDDGGWEVRFTADRYFVRGDESAEISFALWRDGEPVPPRSLEFVAETLVPGKRSSRERLDVEREGDERRAELRPSEHWPDHLGAVQVTATFSAAGLSEKSGTLAFYFTPQSRIPAEFTGGFDDALQGGDLVVHVGTDVKVEGSYRIEANLHDAAGMPVAWGRYQGDLVPGRHRLPLVFYGLIFHDVAAQPPFTLREVRGYRARPGDSPHREDMPSYPGEYRVRDRYVLSDFRRDEYESAHKRAMLDRYRDAIERGVKFAKPSG